MKLTITIGLLLIGHLTFGQNRIQKIDSLLNSLYSKEKINGNFLIAEKGKVIYKHSFGLANEITKEKLNEKLYESSFFNILVFLVCALSVFQVWIIF